MKTRKDLQMKNNELDDIEPRPIALFTAIAIVLGLLLDRIFFLCAILIALIAPLSWLSQWLRKHEQEAGLQRRHS